jgi:hypothetical protein
MIYYATHGPTVFAPTCDVVTTARQARYSTATSLQMGALPLGHSCFQVAGNLGRVLLANRFRRNAFADRS